MIKRQNASIIKKSTSVKLKDKDSEMNMAG